MQSSTTFVNEYTHDKIQRKLLRKQNNTQLSVDIQFAGQHEAVCKRRTTEGECEQGIDDSVHII